jgi:23S rRNA (cytidine1920-2'-O)/16S rRNA (cytidine1409-2'-O)-methyltransferase
MARSRGQASELIAAGAVRVSGLMAPKPASLVAQSATISLVEDPPPYVSRGGIKLAGAVEAFGLDVRNRKALDVGASTGGFTDYLLQNDVGSVVAVDVGYGQLDDRVASDPRVTVLDRTNIRVVEPSALGGPFDLVVGDLSFISLCAVAPVLAAVTDPGADLILLIKPQFEVGKDQVGRNGLVTDPALHEQAIRKVTECLDHHLLGPQAVVRSPIQGAKQGNREFFVWCVRSAAARDLGKLPT